MADEQTSQSPSEVKPKKEFNWTIFWAAVAGIAAVAAAIFAGLPYFKPHEFQLKATGEYGKFSLPMKLKQDLSNFLELSKNDLSISVPLQQHMNEFQDIESYWVFSVTN